MGNDEGGQKEGISWFGFVSYITWGNQVLTEAG